MPNSTAGSKISCHIRCLDPAAVAAAMRQLDPAGTEWVPYTCQLSGVNEAILLIGDDLASRLTDALPVVKDAKGAKILAGLYSAELCECDVATLTGLSEGEVVSRLRGFAALNVVVHRQIHGMNYYRLEAEMARQTVHDAIEGSV